MRDELMYLLNEMLPPEEIGVWLFTENDELHAVPIDLVREGKKDQVVEYLARVAERQTRLI